MNFEEFQEKIRELQKEWLIAGKYDPECIVFEKTMYIRQNISLILLKKVCLI